MEMEKTDLGASRVSQAALVVDGIKPGSFFSDKSKRILIIIALIALILFIVGVALIGTAVNKKCPESTTISTGKSSGGKPPPTKSPSTSTSAWKPSPSSSPTSSPSKNERCKYSEEAKRVGLDTFLKKVHDTYYKLHPENAVWRPKSTADSIRKEYSAYDPTPQAVKKRTDTAYELLNEINGMVSTQN